MARKPRTHVPNVTEDSSRVPAGAPSWITGDLIEKTIETWQPYYEERLLPEDALAMIMGVERMMYVLSRGVRHETVCRSGSRQQP